MFGKSSFRGLMCQHSVDECPKQYHWQLIFELCLTALYTNMLLQCKLNKLHVFIHIHGYISTVLRHGQAFSPTYRFSLSDGTIVSAHTKSKLVRSPATNEPQLYMSLHILQRYVLLLATLSESGRQICVVCSDTCYSLLLPCSAT